MGNVPRKPSPQNLPKPTPGSTLDNLMREAGFVFGEDDKLTTNIKTFPEGWALRDVCRSTYSDYVDLQLIDPTGLPVAIIYGKFTSYDSHCSIAPIQDGERVDLSTCSIVNHWLVDANSAYRSAVNRYKTACRQLDGYPDHQAECDHLYEEMKAFAARVPIDCPVQRIILGNDPTKGTLDAVAATQMGTD